MNDFHQLASELVYRQLGAVSKYIGAVFSLSVEYILELIFWILFQPMHCFVKLTVGECVVKVTHFRGYNYSKEMFCKFHHDQANFTMLLFAYLSESTSTA